MRAQGFSLIELIGVMLVVSIGFLGMANLFSNMNVAQTKTEAAQKVAHYAQACAEYVLQNRRDLGYCTTAAPCSTTVNGSSVTYLSSTMCGSLITSADSTAGYSFTQSGGTSGIDVKASGTTSTGMCPTGVTCRDVIVRAVGPSSTGVSSSITLTLADY